MLPGFARTSRNSYKCGDANNSESVRSKRLDATRRRHLSVPRRMAACYLMFCGDSELKLPSLIFILGAAIIAPDSGLAQRDYTAEECARYHDPERISIERRSLIFDQARAIHPQRRDGPLRYLNVSDDEVREIQAAAFEIVGDVLVTISGVVSGCPCEDGPQCTDQVWVLAHKPNDTIGLLLSKVRGQWQIGTVQRWWLNFEKLAAEKNVTWYWLSDSEAGARLIDEFPTCGVAEKLKQWEEFERRPLRGCKN